MLVEDRAEQFAKEKFDTYRDRLIAAASYRIGYLKCLRIVVHEIMQLVEIEKLDSATGAFRRVVDVDKLASVLKKSEA